MPLACRCDGQHWHARVAHGPEFRKPGVTLEIKSSGFDRTAGRGKMARRHNTHPGCRCYAVRLITMQRDAHIPWRARGTHIFQQNLIQCNPQRVRATAIQINHAPLNRTVVTPIQHRTRDVMCAVCCKKKARKNQKGTYGQWAKRLTCLAGNQKNDHRAASHCNKKCQRRFKPYTKVQPDAYRQTNRHPFKQKPALAKHLMLKPAKQTHLLAPYRRTG